jgi:hypothetical protein
MSLTSFEFHNAKEDKLKDLAKRIGEVVKKNVSVDYFMNNVQGYEYAGQKGNKHIYNQLGDYVSKYMPPKYESKFENVPTFGTLNGEDSRKYGDYKSSYSNYNKNKQRSDSKNYKPEPINYKSDHSKYRGEVPKYTEEGYRADSRGYRIEDSGYKGENSGYKGENSTYKEDPLNFRGESSGYKEYKSISPVRQTALNFEASSSNIGKEKQQRPSFNQKEISPKEYYQTAYLGTFNLFSQIHLDLGFEGKKDNPQYDMKDKYSASQKYEHKSDYNRQGSENNYEK